MIELRQCVTDDDYEVWIGVRRAVLPGDRAPSLDELKSFIKPGDAHLLADLDGELAGSGLMNRSDLGGAHVAPRVLPDKRGRGVGTALLTKLAELAVERGFERAGSHVAGADERSIAFARRFGFEEIRRDVKQVLEPGDAPPPVPREVDGVEFVSIESRPDLLREAWPLGQQGYEDMPIDGLDILEENWLVEEATLPGGSFVAHRRRRDRRLRGPDALAGRADEVRARAHGGAPRLAPARPRDRDQAALDRVGGGERHPRARHLDADGQREHAGRQRAPGLRHDRGRPRRRAEPSAVSRNWFGADVAERYDDSTGEQFDPRVIDATVDFLAGLAGEVPRSSSASAPAASRCR